MASTASSPGRVHAPARLACMHPREGMLCTACTDKQRKMTGEFVQVVDHGKASSSSPKESTGFNCFWLSGASYKP